MTKYFGAIPYQACNYGKNPAYSQSGVHIDPGMEELCGLLDKIREGDFSKLDNVVRYMTHSSYDIRQYSQQLWAHSCRHDQVASFQDCFATVSDSSELFRLVVRIGETLSPRAIKLLMACKDDFDEPELNGYICSALRIIVGANAVDESSFQNMSYLELTSKLGSLDEAKYYYKGKPIHIGDITKELIVAAFSANKNGIPIILNRQHVILSNFTGRDCPVNNGQIISDKDVHAIMDYVEGISKGKWNAGFKYFFGRSIA
jgi:hypothetical protein